MVEAYGGCGARIDFAYGQGSVFSGFTAHSDLDIVIIWGEDELPLPARRPAEELSDPCTDTTQFHDAAFGLDKLHVSGWDVDVAHYTRTRFDAWCALVEAGDGWQERAWPQPLHAVAGFVHGRLLVDRDRVAQGIRKSMRGPSAQLITKVMDALGQQLPEYADALRDCADRDDGWLFHELAVQLVKHAYVAWFAAEGHYLPFPTRLRQWIRHLGLEERGVLLERRIWEATALGERRLAILRFAEHVLAANSVVRKSAEA